ncbi:hypothetical protein GUITHDRAFT_115979 [Guillardia theta CCMP2712]|uniref:Uncharacterized protein n=1 Tax=Guillardia theta (strain CCMP2712) TaxID=905079 RepID=L1IPP1_GUITC|nr:hypothetical protein GUITHDRAFT_115979 [Guillardia theta CCMP2712]EKX37839.1 hypothetical protein GUITHDRAFT_115979 [Guillardia theta CCMP2712]|eukprot:XP_005824819.1 hypothetical protein GUITHDRAFT_115979 [Guillardia theta CCMP2712]
MGSARALAACRKPYRTRLVLLLLLLLSNVAVMWVFHSQEHAIMAVLAFAKSIGGRKTLFDPDFDPKTSNPSACSIGGDSSATGSR